MKRALFLCLLLTGAAYAANDFSADPNCVALWDPTGWGDMATDQMGNGNTWVLDPDVSTGTYKVGDAAAYIRTGTMNLATVDASLSANTPGKNGTSNNTFTVTGWVNWTTLAPNSIYDRFLAKTSSGKQGWAIFQYDNSARLGFSIGYNGGGDWENHYHGTNMTTGRWYHFGITYTGVDKSYRIRIWDDTAGAPLGVDLTGTGTNAMNIEDAIFGFTAAYVIGYFDDVALFNRVLNTTDIDACRGGVYDYAADPNCVSLWEFDTTDWRADSVGTNDWGRTSGLFLDTTNYKTGTAAMHVDYGYNADRSIADASLSAKFPLKNGDTNKKISVCYWFRPTSFALPDDMLLNLTKTSSWSTGWKILSYKPTLLTDAQYTATNPVLTNNQWYHYAATYQDSDKSYHIRVWDQTASTVYDKTGTATANVTLNANALKFASWTNVNQLLAGTFDEIAVFNDILTTAEIDQIRGGTFGATSSVNNWWWRRRH